MRQQPADAIQYRDETIAILKGCLLSNLDKPSRVHPDPAQSFGDMGFQIRQNGTADSNQRFAYQ